MDSESLWRMSYLEQQVDELKAIVNSLTEELEDLKAEYREYRADTQMYINELRTSFDNEKYYD